MADAEPYEAPVRDEWKEAFVFDIEDVFPDEEGEALGDVVDEPDDDFEPDEGLGSGDADGPLVQYRGEDWIVGVPTRDDILAEHASGATKSLGHNLEAGKPVFFMPTDIEETNEYANGYPVYAVRLFGVLMSGAKAEVTITGIRVHFDVRVPERKAPSTPEGDAPGEKPADATRTVADTFESHLRRVLADAGTAGARIESREAYPIRGFHTAPKPYKRIHLSNLQQRKKAIAAVRAADIETASDDRSSYYRKAAREYGLPLSEWAILSNYELTPGPTDKSPLCSHIFRVPVESYRALIDPMAPKEKREAAAKVKAKTPLLLRDRTLVLTWDIETDSDRGTGDVPDAQHKGDNAFMIAMTVHWKDDPTPLKQVLLVDVEAAPDKRWTTVVCGTPQNVLKAFALVYRGFAPEIQAGFNDSDYDWRFIIEKARQWNVLGWMFSMMTASPRRGTTTESVLRWNYHREKKIKISAEESFISNYLKVPGCVPQDVRVCYKKLFPKSETPKAGSLKFYLEISGLPGKADMPFKRMWRYHKESLALAKAAEFGEPGSLDTRAQAAEHMRQVGHYCIIDALRCQQLLVRRNVVNDYRELGSLAFVSLFDCHYYAGGMKVCNLLGAYAHRRNILFSMIPFEQVESGKYPGAYVFPPEKGLTPNPDRLAAIDTAAAELRTALVVLDSLRRARPRAERALEEATKLAAAGDAVAEAKSQLERAVGGSEAKEAIEACETLTEAERVLRTAPASEVAAAEDREAKARAVLEEAFLRFAGDRPVTGLDFASLYPSLIMTYNLSPEKILLTEEEARYWQEQGRSLYEIEFPYNGRTVRGWTIRHNNVPEDIGLYPAVLIDLFNKRAEVKGVLGQHGAVKELIELIFGRVQKAFVEAEVARGIPKEAAEKEAGRRKASPDEVAAALRHVLARAEAEKTRTDAALVPGAPPPRLSPGSTLAEEIADLKRLNKNAKEQIEGIHKLCQLARERAPSPEDAAALPNVLLSSTIHFVYEETCFSWTGANTKQNALKVLMNTFYGEAGNSLSPFFLLQLAGGVTSSGQYNIKRVAEFVQSKGFRIKYGDSVTGNSALIVRRQGVISTVRVDELVPDGSWRPYGGKEATVVPGLEVWQDTGFTPVNRVIRHACGKPIMRVLTHTGVVDCTTDHSLLRPDGAKVCPQDVRTGEELMHATDAGLIAALDQVSGEAVDRGEAFAMGLFAADGSCGVCRYDGGRRVKHSWAINNIDIPLLERAAACLPFPTKILDTVKSSGVHKLVPVGDIKGPTLRYRALFYNAHREKRIPPEILGAELDIVNEFWLGFYAGDGHRAEQLRQTAWRTDQKGKEMATGLWLLGRRLGWEVSLNDRADKPDVFRMTFSELRARKQPLQAIKKLRQPSGPAPEHVYDLETGSHHFHVGPGDLVVHNTDSLYLVCPQKYFSECDETYALGRVNREEWWSAMVRITMRVMNMVRDEVNAFLKSDNGSPYLKMAYEEVLYPVDFDGKKKYFGIPHLNEVNFRPKKLFIRGIEVVKQGQPGLAREIGNRIMWACMALDNKRSVRQIVEDVLKDAVLNGAQWKFDHFIKSDAWKPHKNNKPVHRFIGRMRARHAAEAAEAGRVIARGGTPRPYLYELPEAGERFSYIIAKQSAAFDIHGRKSATKKGDRMEFARAAKELGLEIDVAFYMISYVVGLCARFINGNPQFQSANLRLPEKKRDEACQKAAKKYLENYVKALSNLDSGMLRKRGYAYRRAYGQAADAVRGALIECVGGSAAEVLHGGWLDYELLLPDGDEDEGDGEEGDATVDNTSKVVTALWESADNFAGEIVANDGDAWNEELALMLGIEKNGSDSCPPSPRVDAKTAPAKPVPAKGIAGAKNGTIAARGSAAKAPATRLYAASGGARAPKKRPVGSVVAAHTASSLDRQEAQLRDRLAALVPTVGEIAARYEADLSRLVHHMRLCEHGEHPEIGAPESSLAAEATGAGAENILLGVSKTDQAQLLELRQLWYSAAGLLLTRKMRTGFVAHLAKLKNRRLGVVAAPSRADVKKTIAEAATKLRVSGEVVDLI